MANECINNYNNVILLSDILEKQKYTEYEKEKYSEYILYVENEVNKSNLPIKDKIKKYGGIIWFLEEEIQNHNIISFKQWLLQTERDIKLSQLGL